MYRTSLGTRGETRRAAAEAETAVVGRVRRWKRDTRPSTLAPHVVVPQWVRGERPVAPPSPVKRVSAPPSPTVPEAAKLDKTVDVDGGEMRSVSNAEVGSVLAGAPIAIPPGDGSAQGAPAENDDMAIDQVTDQVAGQVSDQVAHQVSAQVVNQEAVQESDPVTEQEASLADEPVATVGTADSNDLDVNPNDSAVPVDVVQGASMDDQDAMADVELDDQIAPSDALTGPPDDPTQDINAADEKSALDVPEQINLSAVPSADSIDAAVLGVQREALHPDDPPDIADIGEDPMLNDDPVPE